MRVSGIGIEYSPLDCHITVEICQFSHENHLELFKPKQIEEKKNVSFLSTGTVVVYFRVYTHSKR